MSLYDIFVSSIIKNLTWFSSPSSSILGDGPKTDSGKSLFLLRVFLSSIAKDLIVLLSSSLFLSRWAIRSFQEMCLCSVIGSKLTLLGVDPDSERSKFL